MIACKSFVIIYLYLAKEYGHFADVRSILIFSLRYRIILNFEGQAEDLSTVSVIKRVIDATPEGEVHGRVVYRRLSLPSPIRVSLR